MTYGSANDTEKAAVKKQRLLPIVVGLLAVVCLAALFLSLGGFEGLKTAFYRLRLRGEINDEKLREAFAEVYEKNPEAREFVDSFDGVTEFDLKLDLSEDDAFVARDPIPYYVQWDARWGYCQYGDGLMGWTGCGPTALSMVAMGLTGDGTLTPAYIASFAIDNGYCVPGNGTSWTLFSEGAEKLGFTATEVPLWEATMREHLKAGRPIICIMGAGHFTDTGHYIVITSCTDEGFNVLDPYRPSNCKVWSYDEIQGEIRNLWAYEM